MRLQVRKCFLDQMVFIYKKIYYIFQYSTIFSLRVKECFLCFDFIAVFYLVFLLQLQITGSFL